MTTSLLFAALTALAFPPPAETNCPFEISSYLPLEVDTNRLATATFELSFDATPTNNVEIAVGRDANGDGKLALLEAHITFGYDCGSWFVKNTLTGEIVTEPAPTSGRLTRTITFQNGKTYDPNWNIIKLTRRGKFPTDGTNLLKESASLNLRNRYFYISIR